MEKHRARRAVTPRASAASLWVTALAAVSMLQTYDSAAQDVDVAAKPFQYPDDTFITLNGTVASVRPDAFVLDFGGGEIVVEMDEGGPDLGERGLIEGDAVSVYGIIDDDFFASRTIDAGGVFVDRLNRTFYASTIDESDARQRSFLQLSRSHDPFETVVQGRVVELDTQESLTLATGAGTLEVMLGPGALVEDDDFTDRRIEVGDRVSVTGRIEDGFFDEREMVADAVQVLEN